MQLKHEVQDLIDAENITDPDNHKPSTHKNPLPSHQNSSSSQKILMINGGLNEEEVTASFEENHETHQAQEDARVKGSQAPVEEEEEGEEATSEYRPMNRVFSDSGSGSSWLDVLAGREEEIQSHLRVEVLNNQHNGEERPNNQPNKREGLNVQHGRRMPTHRQDNDSEEEPNNEDLQVGWIEESDREDMQAEESGSGTNCVLVINIWDNSDDEGNCDVWEEEKSEEEDLEEEEPEEEDPEEEDPNEEEGNENGK